MEKLQYSDNLVRLRLSDFSNPNDFLREVENFNNHFGISATITDEVAVWKNTVHEISVMVGGAVVGTYNAKTTALQEEIDRLKNVYSSVSLKILVDNKEYGL